MRSLLLLLALLNPSITHACQCPPFSDEEQFTQATVVLEGRVLKLEKAKSDQKITVKPGKIWKGLLLGNVKVFQSDTDCRFPVKEGESFLFFLLKDGATRRLYTNRCQGTRALSEAVDALAKFKTAVEKTAPVPGAPKQKSR